MLSIDPKSGKDKEERAHCLFCGISKAIFIAENEYGYAIRDRFPVTEMHSLMIPIGLAVAAGLPIKFLKIPLKNILPRKMFAQRALYYPEKQGFAVEPYTRKVAESVFSCLLCSFAVSW